MWPRTTACNHLPCSGMGVCMRRRSSAFTAFSFACNLLRIVCRSTVYIPLLLFFTQICVKPRKLNVSGFPSPRLCRLLIANGPNSSNRFVPKSNHDVIRKTYDDDIAVRSLLTPRLDPQVENVMKIDVRQKRRGT